MTEVLKDLRDFLFRGLMFEAETEKFRRAGIQVGADSQAAEAGLLDEVLSPFAVGLRNNALQMARLYALLYCFENSVRALIQERLEEKGGASWWISDSVPKKIREFAESRQKSAQENSWLEGQNKDPIDFIEFGHLADIVISNWEDFADLVPSQHWLKQRMEELEKVRNFIAHNRFLVAWRVSANLYVCRGLESPSGSVVSTCDWQVHSHCSSGGVTERNWIRSRAS
ncbi:MAG TPA: Swt1 family HEPN domain-containing protein [Candidatus Binataceae bacterium]|nr:Swt1 family HEPN domain-containing protein [Candidatus Binataceae bacterium]